MDFTQYHQQLRHSLAASAAAGGPDIVRASELLAVTLEPSIRLTLLDAVSAACAEITSELDDAGVPATVEVRLRGAQADLVVTTIDAPGGDTPETPTDTDSDTARITLRIPEPLKARIEQLATSEGVSVNTWLVRAASAASHSQPAHRQSPPGQQYGRRITGYARS